MNTLESGSLRSPIMLWRTADGKTETIVVTRRSVEHRTRALMALIIKHEVFILGQTIDQKARRDGREARGNEEREKRED